MAGSSDNTQKLFSRIFLGVVVLALSGGMLLYLVPADWECRSGEVGRPNHVAEPPWDRPAWRVWQG